MDIKVVKLAELDNKVIGKVDQFILDNNTNGEFINTIQYISYHPRNRFEDDTIVIIDKGSNSVMGVFLANVTGDRVVSYSGTTYAGPIISNRMSIGSVSVVLQCMLDYYKNKYSQIEIRTIPDFYSVQPSGIVQYFLLKNDFEMSVAALANVMDISKVKEFDDVLKLADSKRRNQIKKVFSEQEFIVVKKDVIEKEIWDEVNHNLSRRYGGKTAHSYGEINELIKRFPNNIEVYIAENKAGEYGALAVVYKYKNVYHTQYLDLNYAMSKANPNLQLVTELIMYAANEGYKTFCFGGSTENSGMTINSGLYEYKAGYGGGSIVLPKYIWRNSKD